MSTTYAGPTGPSIAEPRRTETTDDLLSIVQKEQDSALGVWNTRLQEQRRGTLNSYFSNLRGDEVEGRSTVVTRDIFEQVETLLPQLMEIFMSSNEVVAFEPQGQEDVDLCKQISETVNWVFRKNGGFMVLETMFKDALIQKNGVVKVWWEEDGEAHYARYAGKTFKEYQDLDDDPDFEITKLEGVAPETGEILEQDQIVQLTEAVQTGELGEDWLLALRYNVEGRHVNNLGRIRMDNIPPEEFLINRDARGLDDPTCRFVAHRIRTSASRLASWGIPLDVVEKIPPSQGTYTADQDTIVRSSQDDSNPLNYAIRNDAERQVYVIEAYVRADMDGDGISEWWRVLAGGDYAQYLLEAEPVDGHPFASVTPIPIPHRFYGLSLADVTEDLQAINTTLWRQYLDSLYLATNPRKMVLSEGLEGESRPLANIDQMLDVSVGGWYEIYRPDAVQNEETKDSAQHVLPAFEVHERMKQSRTGISPDAMGINPDAISQHVFGAMVQTSAAAQRIANYARIFAETGVPRIFNLIYKLLCQNQSEPMMLRLRNEYIEIRPTDWKNGLDCYVSVGLGHGSRMEKVNNAQSLAMLQEKLLAGGLTNMVTLENIYATAATLVEALGFKDVDAYITDPADMPPPEPQEDPAEKAVELQAMIDQGKLALEQEQLRLDAWKAQKDYEVELLKLNQEKTGDDFKISADLAKIASQERVAKHRAQQPRATQ